jgi:hypothetical protein
MALQELILDNFLGSFQKLNYKGMCACVCVTVMRTLLFCFLMSKLDHFLCRRQRE